VRTLAVGLLLTCAAVAQDALQKATTDLADDDPDVRLAAASHLGDLGVAAAPAVPLLADAAYDEDLVVAIAAVDALGRIGPAASAAGDELRPLAMPGMSFRCVPSEDVERALRAIGGGPGGAPPPETATRDDLLARVDDPRPCVRMRLPAHPRRPRRLAGQGGVG
jgi:hypothetical protein